LIENLLVAQATLGVQIRGHIGSDYKVSLSFLSQISERLPQTESRSLPTTSFFLTPSVYSAWTAALRSARRRYDISASRAKKKSE
jgi:hypothetical protein